MLQFIYYEACFLTQKGIFMNIFKRVKPSQLVLIFFSILLFFALSIDIQTVDAQKGSSHNSQNNTTDSSTNTNTNTNNNTGDNDPDYLHALETTPKGLHWNSEDFVLADFKKAAAGREIASSSNSKASSYDNQAKIVQSKNPNNPNTSVIKMTNGKYQVGAVWSNPKYSNFFDLEHKQTASMWLYFGNNGSEVPGDGMAFVLHNDKNGPNSIAISANGLPGNGESLGTWGVDWDPSETDPQKIADTAIQNSWALEFDTFRNSLTAPNEISGEGVSYDSSVPNQVGSVANATVHHIAGNYPALASTYKLHTGTLDGTIPRNYFTMQHNVTAADGLSSTLQNSVDLFDKHWHHVTITWTPLDDRFGTLSYSFNDKNTDGTPDKSKNHITTTFKLDTNNFKLDGSKKLYWGFTGSTGKYYENNLIAFESIPSFVDANATASIYNDSQNKPITEKGSSANPDDQITYTYNLEYNGWEKKWNDITAHMQVPTNVKFDSGSVYFDATKNNYAIDPNEFTNNQSMISTPLSESLSYESKKATIELKGHVVKNPDSSYKVPAAHASFEGDNLITDTNTSKFSIAKHYLLLESDSPDITKINSKQDVDISGKLSYIDNSNILDNMVYIHPILNGKTLPIFRLSPENPASGFKIHLTSDQLSNNNTLKFYATVGGDSSNTVTREINVNGSVLFGDFSSQVSFDNVLSYNSSKNRIIPRMGNWFVNVIDSRPKGSSWTVQATGTDLIDYDHNKTLDGNMIFKNNHGNIQELSNNTIDIANHIKDSDNVETKDITKNWSKTSGVLLNFGSHNMAGKYDGTITWSLIDSTVNA